MKKIKSVVSLLLVVVLALSLTACGGSKPAAEAAFKAESAAASASAEAPAAASSAENNGEASYTIGHTNLGAGVWILDMYQKNAQYVADELGMTLNPASANFSSDQMVKDLQNQISSGEQGHLYFGAISTLTPTASELFEKAGVYWGVFSQLPAKEDLDLVNSNPYYVGSVGPNLVNVSLDFGKLAAEMGYKKAAILAGAVGDTSSDFCVNGFTEAFEAAGGEIVATARCADPSEAAAKSDDLLAAYGEEIDCLYSLNMDYVLATIHSAENYGLDNIMFFASDCDAEGLEYVRQGKMIANSNMSTDPIWPLLLVINALDGHKIVDENGNAPYWDIQTPWHITAETADDYEKYWLNEFPIPLEVLKSLLYRYNPDVSYDDFKEVLENYGYDWVMSFHQ